MVWQGQVPGRLTPSQGQGLCESSWPPVPAPPQPPTGRLAKGAGQHVTGPAPPGWDQVSQQVQTQPEPARARMLGRAAESTRLACSASLWARSLGVSWREHRLYHPAWVTSPGGSTWSQWLTSVSLEPSTETALLPISGLTMGAGESTQQPGDGSLGTPPLVPN